MKNNNKHIRVTAVETSLNIITNFNAGQVMVMLKFDVDIILL